MGTEQVESYEDIRAADYRRLIAVLAGPVFTDLWPTGTWPLDEADTGDIGYVAHLCKWLKFDVVELFVTECRVRNLLGKPSVHGAIKAVASELLAHGATRGSRVQELVSEAGVDAAAVRLALVPLGVGDPGIWGRRS